MDYELMKREIDIKMRAVIEQAKDKKLSATDAAAQIEALRAEKKDIEQRQALAAAPISTRTQDSGIEDISNALMEKRAITLGTNGDSGFSEQVFEIAAKHTELVDAVTVETGAMPNTKFPLFSPSVNNIKRVAEDGTGSTVSTAAFAPAMVTPAPYLGYVNVSDYFVKFAPAKLYTKLKELFGKGFAVQMAKEIAIGNGTTEMKGVFVDTGITTSHECAATGAPKLADLLKLVSKLTGRFRRSQLAILINPDFWASIMNEDPKHSYINTKDDFFTFNGVRIIEDDNAPTAVTSGAKLAVCGHFKDYGVAVAAEAAIEGLSKSAGSLNTPVQGTMYFDGKVIVPSSFAVLTAK